MSYLITISIILLGIVVIDKLHNAHHRRRDIALKELRIKIETLKLMTKAEVLSLEDKLTEEGLNAFEVWCSELLKMMGYQHVIVTDAVADGGKDIIAEKEGVEYYIECKLWNDHNLVGRPVIQKLVGACYHDKITKGIVITSSNYTEEAKAYAKTLPKGIDVQLIDGDELVKILHNQRIRFINENPVIEPI